MKWTIGTKIGGLIAVAITMLIIFGIISFQMINNFLTSVNLNTHSYQVIEHQELVLSLLKDAETGQRGYLITGEESYLEPYNSASKLVYQEINTVMELTKDNAKQQMRLASMKPLIDQKFAELQQTIDLRKGKGLEAALKIVLSNKGKTTMDEIRSIYNEIINEETVLQNTRQLTMENNSQTTKSVINLGTSASIIIILFVGFFLIRNISKPLIGITKIAERIASGDLEVELIEVKRKDEIGILLQTFAKMINVLKKMATAAQQIAAGDLKVTIVPQSKEDLLGNNFLQMVNNLRRIIKDTSEGVNLIASSSSEILAATTQVASGSAETATAIAETTTTVEEVRQAAQLSSQKASRVSENAQQVSQVTLNGQIAVDETISGMHDIQNQMESVANTIVRLSEQSQQIGGIIASVTDVADQSNLLAVNAAIEAAKAGEQGKGFAVVAQEIKSLAQQSKQATIQVRNILTDFQKATSAAVMATEQTSKAVESGVKQSTLAGDAIKKLAESSGKALEAASQIVASSQQQSVGMDQIGLAMQNINQAGTENAASMVQAEKAAKGLNELGQKLKLLVGQYKL